MARPIGIHSPGATYHVMARGIHGQANAQFRWSAPWIHLHPVRAGWIEVGRERFQRYRWSRGGQLLAAGLRAMGLSEAALAGMSKGAAPKVVLAWRMRERPAVARRWVSEGLALSHYRRVTPAASRMQRRPGRSLRQLQRKLERLPTGGAR